MTLLVQDISHELDLVFDLVIALPFLIGKRLLSAVHEVAMVHDGLVVVQLADLFFPHGPEELV